MGDSGRNGWAGGTDERDVMELGEIPSDFCDATDIFLPDIGI